MKDGFVEVARIGTGRGGYPRLLVNSRNWCLRLGGGKDDKAWYFTRLPQLFEALTDYLARRGMAGGDVSRTLGQLYAQVCEALSDARQLGARLEEKIVHLTRLMATGTTGPSAPTPLVRFHRLRRSGGDHGRSTPPRRKA